MDQETLKNLIIYDPETGVFTWRSTGRIAGNNKREGRVRIRINYISYKAHRLAFLYMIGRWPEDQVDHINRDPSDNRWSNLREATSSQNRMNTLKRPRDLPRGVYRVRGDFRAKIVVRGIQIILGRFKTVEEATKAYDSAAPIYHGEFAITNGELNAS